MVPIKFTLGRAELGPIDDLERKLENLSPAMAAIASYLEDTSKERINETNVGPDGAPWAPSKRVLEHGGKTLLDSGHLFERIQSRFDKTSAEVGTDLPYAGIHNAGGTIRAKGREFGGADALRTPFGPRLSVRMPKRQFIGFSAADKSEVRELILDHLRMAA